MNVAIYERGEKRRYAVAQSQKLDLDVHTAVALYPARVQVHTPQISVVSSNRIFSSGVARAMLFEPPGSLQVLLDAP